MAQLISLPASAVIETLVYSHHVYIIAIYSGSYLQREAQNPLQYYCTSQLEENAIVFNCEYTYLDSKQG